MPHKLRKGSLTTELRRDCENWHDREKEIKVWAGLANRFRKGWNKDRLCRMYGMLPGQLETFTRYWGIKRQQSDLFE